jgi:hypothetical protein
MSGKSQVCSCLRVFGTDTFANRFYERLGHDLFKTQKAVEHHNVNSTVQYLSVDQHEINQAILTS